MGYFEFKNNETALNETNLMAMQKAIAELLLPIGSTYITQDDTNPSTILGFGTWERSKGKVFVGLDENDGDFNAIGKTGGEKTHTLTEEEMPEHKHHTVRADGPTDTSNLDADHQIAAYAAQTSTDLPYSLRNGQPAAKAVGATTSSGQGKAHNNLQPYEVVGYMWIRRA